MEPGWPEAGSCIHWAAGRGPLRKDDVTTSLSFVPGRELRLEAHAWPAGTAGIRLAVRSVPQGVVVSIDEAPARGLLRRVHNPVLDLLVKLRNVETLRRLENQVRRRQQERLGAAPA